MQRNTESERLRDVPIGELVARLAGDVSLLVRQELELFRTEMSEKLSESAKDAGQAATFLSSAAVATLMALGCLSATVILALALVMPAWGAALIVTLAWGVACAILAVAGKKKIEDVTAPIPKQTIETVREDVEWAKTRTKSASK